MMKAALNAFLFLSALWGLIIYDISSHGSLECKFLCLVVHDRRISGVGWLVYWAHDSWHTGFAFSYSFTNWSCFERCRRIDSRETVLHSCWKECHHVVQVRNEYFDLRLITESRRINIDNILVSDGVRKTFHITNTNFIKIKHWRLRKTWVKLF